MFQFLCFYIGFAELTKRRISSESRDVDEKGEVKRHAIRSVGPQPDNHQTQPTSLLCICVFVRHLKSLLRYGVWCWCIFVRFASGISGEGEEVWNICCFAVCLQVLMCCRWYC